jgi:hypothetical protein
MVTLIARRKGVVDKFGEPAWLAFVRDMNGRYPTLESPFLATATIAIDEFLAINDEIVKRFYQGNPRVYFELGRASARWALTEGPYQEYARRGLPTLIEFLPTLYRTYYAETRSRIELKHEGNVVHYKILDLEQWHPYLEFVIVAFAQGTMEVVTGKRTSAVPVKAGPAALKDGIYYRILL